MASVVGESIASAEDVGSVEGLSVMVELSIFVEVAVSVSETYDEVLVSTDELLDVLEEELSDESGGSSLRAE